MNINKMLRRRNLLQRASTALLLRLFSKLENNYVADMQSNGEAFFLRQLSHYLAAESTEKTILFDIGANVGNYTQILLDLCQDLNQVEVHLFEPTQSCFQTLLDRYGQDGRVITNRCGVSNGNETKQLYSDRPGSGLASLYPRILDLQGVTLPPSEEVQLVRLDDYIRKKGIQHIHFMKVDIEGHELAAFEGLGTYLRNDFIDFIQFEYGGANLDSHTTLRDLYNQLSAHGFVMAKVMRRGLEVRIYKPFMENYQYANYVAFSQALAGAT